MSEKVYEKEVISDPALLPEIEEFVVNIAREANLHEDKFNNLALSVSEAASNAMVHGNKMDINKTVKIKVIVNDEKIKLSFTDQGSGFKLEEVPDPTKPENILKDSGRGIHIMKSFMDKVEFRVTPNGTETKMELSLQ